MCDIAAIVLAAGLSRRMGKTNKLLQTVNGDILLRRVVRACIAVSDQPVTIVTGHQKALIERALDDQDVNFVYNADFENGQMTSVDAGLRGAPEAQAYVLALGDQPHISDASLAQLLAAHNARKDERITIPFVDGARGNPIIIPAIQRTRMLADPVNLGCRKLTRTSPDLVHYFETRDQSFVVDIDTPDDLARANGKQLEHLGERS